ncbi:MAG: ATP-dependent helicase [Candidatus Pacebacteria bacterium]|nr:ATP-dependent helicase [Candidatus Paceibacterota bacterium]
MSHTTITRMKTTAIFDTLYARLNSRQKEAVDAIEGPVMVIAGPGTGKTQILTLRIANILRKTDIPADAILALTFTNAAAANMRKRLVSIIGSDGYRVSIFTFHSFAHHVIDNYPERFASVVGRSNASEVERIDIVRSLLDQGSYEILKPLGEPYHNVPEVLRAISNLKREGFSPVTFRAWVAAERTALELRDDLYHEKGAHAGKMKSDAQKAFRVIEKNEELGELYRRYQDELARKKRFDFDDSLLLLIEAMEANEDFLRELQEEYQYFLVDEHQDTNGAQNKILELLATYFERPNLFVVGDEKQAIFRFQGASLANFLYFERMFTDVRRITLDTNYRSHQGVLDAAQSLIEHSASGLAAPLVAHASPANKDLRIKVYQFGADDEELLFLAESVKRQLDEGVPPHEIAVLYRNNRDVDDISDYFERLSIPFLIESGHGVLDDPDIRKFNLLLRAVEDLANDDVLAKVLFIGFLHIAVPDAYAILRTARAERRGVYEVLVNHATCSLSAPETVDALARRLTAWKTVSENEPFLNLFESVARESELLEHIQHSTFHTEKFDKLVRLFDEMKAHVRRSPFFSLSDYAVFLRILEEHNLTLEAEPRHTPNAVRLMTAHHAKGLEFDHVYIVHAYDGHWGGKRSKRYFQLPVMQGDGAVVETADTEDERRLFYVAVTRARRDVYVSYAAVAPDGRDRVPSQFIEEIRPEYRVEESDVSLQYAGKRPPLFVQRVGRHGSERYRDFVCEAFRERGISATALNNYLTCPWKWFYENFFYTQFVPTVHQQKGTAVHGALEDFFNARNKDATVGREYLVACFKRHMEDIDIQPVLFDRIMRDTGAALAGWYDAYHATWSAQTKNELAVNGVLLDDTIRLTGKIDKLECLDDKCRDVSVVDYKTGKPKSRNDIEGLTKSAQSKAGAGGYRRQITFYKLLLDRYNEGQYRMQEGVLDFVEPNESGKYKRESFVITSEEAVALEDEIRRVAQEIMTLSFWDTRCGDDECSACRLRDMQDE